MADSFIQLPADSTGKQLDTALVNMGVGTTAVHREKVVVADPLSTSAFAVVTSSQGLQVSSTQAQTISGTVTVLSASSGLVQISGTPTILSASSGLIQISGIPTVTATAATNPWSSAPGFNIPTISVSSGLAQVSAIQVSPTSSVAGASLLVITSSFGLVTQSTQPVTITSGTVTLSSIHTVTATAATNPWSSAPGFNVPVVSVSSGLVQISGTATVVSVSSGFVQISGTPAITSTSVVLSSAGLTQIAGTVTVLSASSGLVQISGTPAVTSTSVILSTAGITAVYLTSTSAAVGPVTSSFGVLGNLTTSKIVPVLAASSGLVSIDLWQGTSSLSPSFIVATSISKISTSPGSLYALHAFTTAPTGAVIRLYNAGTSGVVMNTSVIAAYPTNAQSTVGMNAISYNLPPTGWFFSTQCSFDVVLTATSTATVAGTAYVTVGYSTV